MNQILTQEEIVELSQIAGFPIDSIQKVISGEAPEDLPSVLKKLLGQAQVVQMHNAKAVSVSGAENVDVHMGDDDNDCLQTEIKYLKEVIKNKDHQINDLEKELRTKK